MSTESDLAARIWSGYSDVLRCPKCSPCDHCEATGIEP